MIVVSQVMDEASGKTMEAAFDQAWSDGVRDAVVWLVKHSHDYKLESLPAMMALDLIK